jgi:hypothetical protein
MIEHLFGSKTRSSLLKLFFRDQEKSFYVRELSRLLDVQINAIRRELELLVSMGLIKEIEKKEEDVNNALPGETLKKFYILDLNASLYPELRALILKSQMLDEKHLVDTLVESGGNLDLFLLTGRFTGDKDTPVDLLMVGDLKERTIMKLIAEYEKKFGFPIRYTVLRKEEFFERRNMMDKFLYAIFEGEGVKVVNKLNV